MASLQRHKINFVNRYREDPADAQKKRRIFKMLLPLIGFTAVIIIVELVLLFRMFVIILPGISEAKDYLNDPAIEEQYTEAQAILAEAQLWQSNANNLETAKGNLLSFPALTGDILQSINNSAGSAISVDMVHFSVSTGTVELSGSASLANQSKVPQFVSSLKESGVFNDVVYYYGEEIKTVDYSVNTYGLYPEVPGDSGYLYVFTVIGNLQGGDSNE